MYIDPTLSDWIAAECELSCPIPAAGSKGAITVARLCCERTGVDMSAVSFADFLAAIRDWQDRFIGVLNRSPSPREEKKRQEGSIYMEDYIEQLMIDGIITLQDYSIALNAPVTTFIAAVWGAISRRREQYTMQGDLMAVITNLMVAKSGRHETFKSSDFYNFGQATKKQNPNVLYNLLQQTWGRPE